MKLLRLKLDVSFRSLPKGFEVHFLREWNYKRCFEFHPYCLAGRNGSGKSNVLEALAAIFYHIDCIYLDLKPEGFEFDADLQPDGFRPENATPDAFELEYLIPDSRSVPREPWPKEDDSLFFHIRIAKRAGADPVIHWLNKLQNGETSETVLTRAEVKAYLPTYVLGYSSGRNEILSLPFFKMRFIHFDEYRQRLTTGVSYGGSPEGRLIYLDEQFSQAILLCHFLFPNDAILRVFEEKIDLAGIERFRIIIQRHHRLPVAVPPSKAVSPDESRDKPRATVELTSMLSGYTDRDGRERLGLIDKLIKCSTTHYEDYSTSPDGEGCDLYLDYWVTDATRQAFQFHFGDWAEGSSAQAQAKSALNLFQGLQTLLTLNHYNVDNESKAELYRSGSLYVNETISTPASHERIIRFKEGALTKRGVPESIFIKALSDGEHQLLHTIGLCLLFRHEPALFLLDEPETHLNPDWRASYVSTLRAALEADEATKNVMREVLLTSHSPFIVSDCQSENVLVFQKNDDGGVEWHRPAFNTFGASANTITMKVFGRRETIGDFALSKLEDFRHRLDRGENPDTLMTEVGEQLGDSVEKSLFLSQAIDKKEDH